jgi:DNA repair exonuclease SbcCD ATPase subunit
LAFLANLHPQSQEMRERQSILLSKADTLRQEINEFSDALRAAEVERLRLRLEELQNSCRAAEDEVNRVRQEQGALQNALNEAGKKVNAATARWREVRGCPTPSRFPTPEETKAARELAEGARLALVEAQGEATRAAEAYSAWDSRMKKAAQEYDRLVWEHMKVQAAIEGKPLHDPQTALKAIPSEEQPGPLKLAVR